MMSIGAKMDTGPRVRTKFLPAENLGVRVQTEENALVHQGVLLLCPGAFLDLGVCGTDDGLDLSAVDKAGNIGVRDLGCRKSNDEE